MRKKGALLFMFILMKFRSLASFYLSCLMPLLRFIMLMFHGQHGVLVMHLAVHEGSSTILVDHTPVCLWREGIVVLAHLSKIFVGSCWL